jgi:hypothetical protein
MAVSNLSKRLISIKTRSNPFIAFSAYLERLVSAEPFLALSAVAENAAQLLGDVRYTLLLRGGTVTVSRQADETNYSKYLKDTFARFRQTDPGEYRFDFNDWTEMNQTEERIVEAVERLEPAAFTALSSFCVDHADFFDPVILSFEREIQFYLAGIGAPVPGSAARLSLYDRMYTHFETEESAIDTRGKLETDLEAIHETLTDASARSIFITNELFNSTTLRDALFLGKKIMQRITDLRCLCVCVTFMDELSTMNGRIVSLVSEIEPGSDGKRTYRIVRKKADGRAYAVAIAEKWGLSGERIKERLR